jgi:Gpi18-like mannosyltransferase
VLDQTNLDLEPHFLPWLEQIRSQGLWKSVSQAYSEYGYTPFYSYAVGLANAAFPSGTDGKTVIKSVSILFDYIAAFLVYAIARLHWGNGLQPVAGFAAVLFAPTVFLNGAYWGQSDIIFTTFLLACIYLLLVKADIWAMVCFGIALAIKLQAAWLGPFILMMMMRGRIRWWMAIIPPVMYLVLALPALLVGRQLSEVTTIYFTQIGTQSSLNCSVSNLYFFPQYFFSSRVWWPELVPYIAKASILLTGLLGLMFSWKASRGRMEEEAMLVAAVVSVLILPQFLPHMHDRYFFIADVFIILLAAWSPVYWPAAALMQFNSIVSYVLFLWGREMLSKQVPGCLTPFGFTNNLQPVTGLIAIAGIFNFLLLVWFWRRLKALQH